MLNAVCFASASPRPAAVWGCYLISTDSSASTCNWYQQWSWQWETWMN